MSTNININIVVPKEIPDWFTDYEIVDSETGLNSIVEEILKEWDTLHRSIGGKTDAQNHLLHLLYLSMRFRKEFTGEFNCDYNDLFKMFRDCSNEMEVSIIKRAKCFNKYTLSIFDKVFRNEEKFPDIGRICYFFRATVGQEVQIEIQKEYERINMQRESNQLKTDMNRYIGWHKWYIKNCIHGK